MKNLRLLSLTAVFPFVMAWTSPPQQRISLGQQTIQSKFYLKVKSCRKKQSQLLPSLFMVEEEKNENIQNEIDEMKLEALKKLNDLDVRISSTTRQNISTKGSFDDRSKIGSAVSEPTKNDNTPQSNAPTEEVSRDPLYLLSDTRWKVTLNIGREQGTWMPKDWGVSGDRLIIGMEVNFTGDQLYEREDFLGGLGGSRVLRVKDNQMTLAPSLKEGVRTIRALQGGWTVAKGQGPMGTDVLRFYFEIEEQICREGSDTFCPLGRIYCNCGYFSKKRLYSGRKEDLRQQLESMEKGANAIEVDIENDTAFFSLDKIKKSAKLMKLRAEMQKTAEMYSIASVREPDSSILKFSNDVGLTKEGGVCCKVEKSMGGEYHILGRFSIAPSNFL